MGEGRTASWRKLWNECRAGRGGVSVCLTLHNLYSILIFIDFCMGEGTKGGLVEETYEMSAGQGGVGWVSF